MTNIDEIRVKNMIMRFLVSDKSEPLSISYEESDSIDAIGVKRYQELLKECEKLLGENDDSNKN